MNSSSLAILHVGDVDERRRTTGVIGRVHIDDGDAGGGPIGELSAGRLALHLYGRRVDAGSRHLGAAVDTAASPTTNVHRHHQDRPSRMPMIPFHRNTSKAVLSGIDGAFDGAKRRPNSRFQRRFGRAGDSSRHGNGGERDRAPRVEHSGMAVARVYWIAALTSKPLSVQNSKVNVPSGKTGVLSEANNASSEIASSRLVVASAKGDSNAWPPPK